MSLLDGKATRLRRTQFPLHGQVSVSFRHIEKAWCEAQGPDGDPLLGVLQGEGALLVRRIQQEDGAQHLFAHGHCHLNLRLLQSRGPLVLPADDFAKG